MACGSWAVLPGVLARAPIGRVQGVECLVLSPACLPGRVPAGSFYGPSAIHSLVPTLSKSACGPPGLIHVFGLEGLGDDLTWACRKEPARGLSLQEGTPCSGDGDDPVPWTPSGGSEGHFRWLVRRELKPGGEAGLGPGNGRGLLCQGGDSAGSLSSGSKKLGWGRAQGTCMPGMRAGLSCRHWGAKAGFGITRGDR